MRRFLFAATRFLLAISLMPTLAYAGNVLLPSASGGDDSSSTPSYLGLGGSSSSSAPATTAPAAPAPAQIAAPTPVAIAPPAPVTSGHSSGGQSVASPASAVISPIDAVSAAKLPPGAVPTQVIYDNTDTAAALAQATQNMPYALTLSIDGKSIFGAADVQEIEDKLGLKREQIPSSCILTVRGLMQTDKGSAMIVGEASPQVQVRYDGMITGYMMTAAALCTAGQLPPGSGFITQTNGRYIVTLQQINCPAPTRQATQLNIVYNGTDSSQCAYR